MICVSKEKNASSNCSWHVASHTDAPTSAGSKHKHNTTQLVECIHQRIANCVDILYLIIIVSYLLGLQNINVIMPIAFYIHIGPCKRKPGLTLVNAQNIHGGTQNLQSLSTYPWDPASDDSDSVFALLTGAATTNR
jgi:hypothetical protein